MPRGDVYVAARALKEAGAFNLCAGIVSFCQARMRCMDAQRAEESRGETCRASGSEEAMDYERETKCTR